MEMVAYENRTTAGESLREDVQTDTSIFLSDNNFIGSNFKFAQTCSSILLLKGLSIPYGVVHTANKKTTTCDNCSLTRG